MVEPSSRLEPLTLASFAPQYGHFIEILHSQRYDYAGIRSIVEGKYPEGTERRLLGASPLDRISRQETQGRMVGGANGL